MPPSPPDEPSAADIGTRCFGPDRRLRRRADFTAVLAAPRAQSLRAARHWLSMTVVWKGSEEPVVRFGITVGRRNARRAVDRALIKRIVREASRQAARGLELHCASRKLRLDVAFRLKAARDWHPTPSTPTVTAWRRELRMEADVLLARLGEHLAALPA